MSLEGRAIAVLGSFRSGTSSVAAVLSNLGVYFGAEEALYGANEFNPAGHYELKDMQALHLAIMDSFGMQFYSGRWLPSDWKSWPASEIMVQQAAGLLIKHFSGHPLWGWKEPAGSTLVPIYKAALSGQHIAPKFVICVRHPLSVIASMRTRSGAPGKRSHEHGPRAHSRIDLRTMGTWVYYTLASLRDTQGDRRVVVSYENFLENPRGYVNVIDESLELHATDEQKDAAVASVDPNLSHTRFTNESLGEWPGIVRRLYSLCLRADANPIELNAGQFDAEIDELWEEWLHVRRMIRPDLRVGETLHVEWDDARGPKEFDRVLDPVEGWASIQIPIPEMPATPLKVIEPKLPCQMWLRKAVWRHSGGVSPAVLRPGANGTLEDVYGLKLVTVLGSGPLLIEPPRGVKPTALELEFLIDGDTYTLTSIVTGLREELDRIDRKAAPSSGSGPERRSAG